MNGTIIHCHECDEPGEGNWRGFSLLVPDDWVIVYITDTMIFCSDECLVTFFQKKMWRRGRGLTVLSETEEK